MHKAKKKKDQNKNTGFGIGILKNIYMIIKTSNSSVLLPTSLKHKTQMWP